MVFKSLGLSAVLAGALVTAAPVHAEYANDGYDYVNGQWSGWYRAYVSDNVWDEYFNGQYYWRRDFNIDWVTQYLDGLWFGYYATQPNDIYIAFNNTWVPSAQYIAMLQAQLQAQQQSGGVTLTIGGSTGVDYTQGNFGADFGSFLDYLGTCPTCPRLSPGPWTLREGQAQ
jgi:hypothetical protein